MSKINYSFEQWCLDNNRQDLLDRWDHELNEKLPFEVSYRSNKKYWFKCPRGIHESQLQDIQYFPNGRSKEMYCTKCRSFAQYILDNYTKDYLDKLTQLNPNENLWEIACKSNKLKLNIECFNNNHHKYTQTCEAFVVNGCGYCSHRYKPLLEDSLGYLYPEIFDIWSDKNENSPYDYYPNSTQEIWLKCKDGMHQDYKRRIETSVMLELRCPKCGMNNRHIVKGEEHNWWKGGITPINKMIRTSSEYKDWRSNIYEQQDYTCQCCGFKGKKLNCHHINSFSEYEDLRVDDNNGITLCIDCHDVSIPGSFHNTYGTTNNTPEQLEEYINKKRKELGINIPFTIEDFLNGNILKQKDIKKIL